MKRILAVSAIAIAACLGYNSAANAQSAVSTHSGTVAVTCAIGSTNGTLQPVTNTITGAGGFSGNFPKVLSSASGTGTPGSFVALCNTNNSDIAVALSPAATVPPGQTGETVDYTLSAGSGAFSGASFLTTHTATSASPTAPSSFDNIPFNYADTPSTLTVSAKITADTNKVLVGSTAQYSVPITATLTPQ